MEPITLTLLIKLGLSLFLIIGGFIALIIGNRLYRSGVGLSVDGSKVEYEEVKIHLKTVGSVVMATSVAWGGLGYLAIPKYSNSSSGVEISFSPSIHSENLDFDSGSWMLVNGVKYPFEKAPKDAATLAFDVHEKISNLCNKMRDQKKISTEQINSDPSCRVRIY